ncbi:UvrD-helicase domain-containing protein [Desulfovibrio sp. OttesenSCG-928-C06]|nr:UvrD-helicase domain-containing protein [Desulfovibrio sp. OttesenSCG-928-C06]
MLEKIKASAGSGKTYTLTRRFMQLLAEMNAREQEGTCTGACRNSAGKGKARVFSEILAMTFTNKAAAEMKIRVIEALKKLVLEDLAITAPKAASSNKLEQGSLLESSGKPDKEPGEFSASEASAWLESILKRYDSLNIRTIDSLLALLVRISAVSLGIPPDFEISFDDAAYLDSLYDELLDRAAAGEHDLCQLLEDCAAYLVYHTQFEGFTPRERIRVHIRDVLSRFQDSSETPCLDSDMLYARLEHTAVAVRESASRFEQVLKDFSVEPNGHFKNFLKKCLNVESAKDLPINSKFAQKASFTECVNKGAVNQVTDAVEAFYAKLCADLELQNKRAQIYSSAVNLLPFARAASILRPGLDDLRSKSGVITGSMLPNLAREVLNFGAGVSEACCRMGSELTHMLIDEFQDTSSAQWEAIEPLVVECLSRGGSVRYVGDVKQAIYSWRGGDSTLFDKVSELPELLAIEPKPVFTPLEFNWRSAPVVVNHNNDFFSRLEDPETALQVAARLLPRDYPEMEVAGAAAALRQVFAQTSQKLPPARTESEESAEQDGFVSIHKLPPCRPAEFEQLTGAAFKELFAEDLLPRRSPGDIAVLVRTGVEAALAAGWLMELGLPVVTEHSFRLSGNPLIRRLVAFLRFIDYPADDLSFWDFISGPECFCPVAGIAPERLMRWLAAVRLEQSGTGRSQTSFRSLHTLFKRDFPEVWRLLLEPFHNQSGFMNAYDTMSELYSRYALLERFPEQEAYLRRFLELLHMAERRGQSSPASFLEFWDDKGAEEKLSMPEMPDAVRIMTLHKSKGLEFPVVVIPFHRFTDRNVSEIAFTQFEGLNLIVKDGAALGSDYYRKKRTAALEKLHLLYVGWTRASEELHLLVGGTDKDLNKNSIPRVLDYMLEELPFDENGCYTRGQRPYPHAQSSQDMPAPGASAPEQAGQLPCKRANQPEAPLSVIIHDDTATVPDASPFTAQEESPAVAYGCSGQAIQLPELEDDWRPMGWLPRLRIFRSPVPEAVYNERLRGILFHNALENLYIPENHQQSGVDDKSIELAVDYALRSTALPFDCLDTARSEALSALRWFCALPQCALWMKKGRREQSIMDADGKMHRMDLLVEDGADLLVVDYKSGRARPEYHEQVRHYLELLAPGMKNSGKLSGVLVYLDEQRLEEVVVE